MNYYTERLDVDGWRCFLGDSVESSARLCPLGRGVPRRGQHSPEDLIRYRLLLEFFESFAAGVTTAKLQ